SDLSLLHSFLAYDPKFRGGVFLATGDLDGDFKADLLIGVGNGGQPHVNAFRGTDLALLANFNVHDGPAPNQTGAIPLESGGRVALGDVDADGRYEMIFAKGQGTRPRLRAYSLLGGLHEVMTGLAFDPNFSGGVFVGGR